MAKLTAIINMKGGVGKTTLTFNLASYLAEVKGQRVLLIDLDPQANATAVATDPAKLKTHLSSKKTVADIFVHAYRTYGPVRTKPTAPLDLKDFVYVSFQAVGASACLHIVPSELILSSVLKGMTLGPYDLNQLLTEAVQAQYDYIFFDCAPTNSSLTTVALNSAKSVLVPMISDSFGLHGTELMRQVLAEHKYDYGVEVRLVGVVLMMWNGQANQVQASNSIIQKWPPNSIFTSRISHSNWYRVANGKRDVIWNTPAHQNVKQEFDAFVTEFIAKA